MPSVSARMATIGSVPSLTLSRMVRQHARYKLCEAEVTEHVLK